MSVPCGVWWRGARTERSDGGDGPQYPRIRRTQSAVHHTAPPAPVRKLRRRNAGVRWLISNTLPTRVYTEEFVQARAVKINNRCQIFARRADPDGRESTTVMNNDNENEVMEEANGEAEAAEVAQRAQEVVGVKQRRILYGGGSGSCGRGRGRGRWRRGAGAAAAGSPFRRYDTRTVLGSFLPPSLVRGSA